MTYLNDICQLIQDEFDELRICADVLGLPFMFTALSFKFT